MVKISLPVFGQVEVQAFDGERGAIVRLPDAKAGNLPLLFAVEPPFSFFTQLSNSVDSLFPCYH
jgi:hypothetical protein